MEIYFAWLFLCCGIFAAVWLGFYWMANARRSVPLEIASFALSLVAGIGAGLAIAAIATIAAAGGDSLEYVTMCMSLCCSTTCLAATPRLLFQAYQHNQFTIGFLFRLSAYAAVLLVLIRASEREYDLLFGVAGCSIVFFYIFGVLLWRAGVKVAALMFVPSLWLLYVCVAIVLIASGRFSANFTDIFDLFAGFNELQAVALGVAAFGILTFISFVVVETRQQYHAEPLGQTTEDSPGLEQEAHE